jgi:peptide methionine sulfoxide reductase MsrA
MMADSAVRWCWFVRLQAQAAIAAEEERTGRVLSTKLELSERFWRAESYHQRYLEKKGQSAVRRRNASQQIKISAKRNALENNCN